MSSTNYVYDLALDKEANIYVIGKSDGSMTTVQFIQNPTSANPISNISPVEFRLEQNLPNPFNPATVIRYSLIENCLTTLKIFDAMGKEVVTLVNETQNAGWYNIEFNGTNFSSGIYFYELTADGYGQTKRMVLLK